MAQGGFAVAVHTLVLLARSPDPATSEALARSVNIHASCLRRVLSMLAQSRLVVAYEGRDGGYRLARSATEITLADVYHAVDGEPLLRLNPAAANPRCPVSVAMRPALAAIAADAEARFREALAGRTLADVAALLEVSVA
jgi:Rrf2 family protein